jgi:DNA-binding NarL/FixJ family response regulator
MAHAIILAHESDLVLLGMQIVLANDNTWRMLEQVRSSSTLFETVKQTSPEMIVLSECLDPFMRVLDIVEYLNELAPKSRLLILGNRMDGILIRELFACGVMGYLYVGDDLCENLPTALSFLSQHRPYLSPTASAEYLVLQNTTTHWKLDPESRTVLRLLAQGVSFKKISEQLKVSPRHVYWVCEKLRNRFGATTNAQLMTIASEEGFTIRE